MDQPLLVDIQLEDGMAVVAALAKAGYDIAAACWVKDSDERRWLLFLASRQFRDGGSVEARKVLFQSLRHDPLAFDGGATRFVPEDHPLVADVANLRQRRSEQVLIHTRPRFFGGMEVEEVFVLPKVSPSFAPANQCAETDQLPADAHRMR